MNYQEQVKNWLLNETGGDQIIKSEKVRQKYEKETGNSAIMPFAFLTFRKDYVMWLEKKIKL